MKRVIHEFDITKRDNSNQHIETILVVNLKLCGKQVTPKI